MDVKRIIEFIRKSQARAEARMKRDNACRKTVGAHGKKADVRAPATEKRRDRRIDAIKKLLRRCERMLAKTDKALAELRKGKRGRATLKKARAVRNGR